MYYATGISLGYIAYVHNVRKHVYKRFAKGLKERRKKKTTTASFFSSSSSVGLNALFVQMRNWTVAKSPQPCSEDSSILGASKKEPGFNTTLQAQQSCTFFLLML